MKKAIIAIIIIIVLIFSADKIYQIYSLNYVNGHESVVLINNQLSENEVDRFFNLKKGTFETKKHLIVFSLERKEHNILDKYINLPTKMRSGIYPQYECSIEYEQIRTYGFYDYEIGNGQIIARLISNDASSIKDLNSNQTVAERRLDLNFKFGEVNIFNIDLEITTLHCP